MKTEEPPSDLIKRKKVAKGDAVVADGELEGKGLLAIGRLEEAGIRETS